MSSIHHRHPPTCYWCGDRVARCLRLRGSEYSTAQIYCSLACAACAALYGDMVAGVYWCQRCWEWHHESKGCPHLHTALRHLHGEGGRT